MWIWVSERICTDPWTFLGLSKPLNFCKFSVVTLTVDTSGYLCTQYIGFTGTKLCLPSTEVSLVSLFPKMHYPILGQNLGVRGCMHCWAIKALLAQFDFHFISSPCTSSKTVPERSLEFWSWYWGYAEGCRRWRIRVVSHTERSDVQTECQLGSASFHPAPRLQVPG